MLKLPRVVNKGFHLAFAGFAGFMMVIAANGLLNTSFDTTPPWAMIICIAFLATWFGVVGWFAFSGLVALQTIELDRGEIRVRLGSIVLRRIHAEQVKTVGIGALSNKNKNRYGLYNGTVYLVLSEHSPETLNEKGKRFLHSNETAKLMQFSPVKLDGFYAAAKAYLLNHIFRSLLWVEYTHEMETALRTHLTTAIFLLNERQDNP